MQATATGVERIAPKLSGKLHVETVSEFEEFLALECTWDKIVKESRVEHPFLEHSWIRTWWECFGAGSQLNVLVVRENEEVIAIAPLILSTVRMFGIPVRRLGFFYNAHVPRADVLIARRHEEVYRVIWEHLRSIQKSWDLLQLCQLRADVGTLETIQRMSAQDGLSADTWISGASPLITLDSSWQQFYEGLPAKHRSNLRNRFKRLNQTGPVAMETVAKGEAVEPALQDGLRLEESAWKKDAGTAISCDPNVQNFYETFAHRAAEKNWLRLNFLTANDQRIAFDYSLQYRDQTFLLKLGYDQAYSAYSPSNLLLSMAVEDAYSQSLVKYDFLGESAPWKVCWTKEEATNYWLFVFSKSLKGRLLHFLKFHAVPKAKAWRARRAKESA